MMINGDDLKDMVDALVDAHYRDAPLIDTEEDTEEVYNDE